MEETTDIDIIILSYAKTSELQTITQSCIDSLLASEDPLRVRFTIVVIESEKNLQHFQYGKTKTIYPDLPFGYHRYMNLGLGMTSSRYVCLCNNDLLFHKNWASEILLAMEDYPTMVSASPICSFLNSYTGIYLNSGVRFGYRVGYEISGWCLFVIRSVFDIIGKLDENYIFSGADHDYANTLAAMNLQHGLVTSSIVDHLYNSTLITQSSDRQEELKAGGGYHSFKWGHRMLP